MTYSIRSNAYRWLAAMFAVVLVLGLLVGSSQDTAQAIDPGETDIAYVADGYNFPDALMGATLAGLNTAPMLGVRSPITGDAVPPETAAELDRLTNNKVNTLDTIYVFGGPAAVSDKVVGELGAWANNVTRIAGDNRFATMKEISEALPTKARDSDLLDGMDSTDFLGATDKAADSELLDGFDSSQLRFVNLQLYGLHVSGGATHEVGSFGDAGIALPDSGTPAFAAGFTVPPDYTPGDTFTIHLTWYTSDTSCGFDLRPNFTSFARVGQTFPGGSASAGLSAVGFFGTALSAPGTAKQVSTKQYRLESPDADDLEPNDSVAFGLFRSSTSGADTCTGDLMVHSVALSY